MNTQSKSLQVGDRVRVVGDSTYAQPFRLGETATVTLIQSRRNNDPLVHVRWDDLVMGSTYAARNLEKEVA